MSHDLIETYFIFISFIFNKESLKCTYNNINSWCTIYIYIGKIYNTVSKYTDELET